VQKNKKIPLPKFSKKMFTKIAIIGTGNVGTWLFKVLQNQKNLEVFAVSGRKIETLPKDFDLYIFSLKDDIYEDVLQQIPFKMQCAVHTSGSLSQNIVAPYSENFGVLYPYQSITNYELRITSNHRHHNIAVPLCIEGCHSAFEDKLCRWASSIFDEVHKISEKQRFAMHLAAVFANNFTNAMYEIAYQIFKDNHLDWSLILPLLKNTLEKVKHNPPHSVQTGPAKRNDVKIMEKHCNALYNEDLETLYRIVSKIISKTVSFN
jgi:predicted short-subunit dehydrogenase-like oxidoreductase (DUF2520 family)